MDSSVKKGEHPILVSNEPVPEELMPTFHKLIKSTNSRYTSNPRKNAYDGNYRVNYSTPDNEMSKKWNDVLDEYNEKNRIPTFFEKIKIKLYSLVKNNEKTQKTS